MSVLLRWFVAIVALTGVSAHVAVYASRPELTPIASDGFDYYVYLPSWFLFGDTTLQAVADDCCGGRYPDWTAMTRSPRTSRWLNPHPVGVAVMTAPFFALAHGLTRWSGLPPDGFSLYYQHGAALAGLSYMLAGLAILRRLLRRHTSDGVALATLTTLTFGTNLFHYGVFDATYSHAFSFALVCGLMALTERWWDRPTARVAIGLGAVAGLVVLVRHTNVLVLAVVPLFGIGTWQEARARLSSLATHRWPLLAAAALSTLVVFPQLALYRAATGAWLPNPYSAAGGSFAFAMSPRLLSVLFSVQKGLFFWSPALLVGVAGLARPTEWGRKWRVAALAALALQTYLVASWHDWQLGGSYGHRGFTDLAGLFAPFLAAAFTHAARGSAPTKAAVSTAAALAVALSVFQMLQYWWGILPIANISLEQYGRLFLTWR